MGAVQLEGRCSTGPPYFTPELAKTMSGQYDVVPVSGVDSVTP